jgi:hypothetical protein
MAETTVKRLLLRIFMLTCIHTYLHTRILAQMHTCIHTYMRTSCMYTYICVLSLSLTHTHTYTHRCSYNEVKLIVTGRNRTKHGSRGSCHVATSNIPIPALRLY